VVGRRGGRSRIAALIAVFLAAFKSYREILAPGERGVVMVLAADREQARVAFGYIEALLDQVPMLATLIAHRTKEEITLRNRITIRVHTASFRAVRGYTVVAAICDEIAFWRSEDSANPDVEIVNAIRPAMATVPEPLLLGSAARTRDAACCGRRSRPTTARTAPC
jgi:phage terminase large subunit-like protein